MRFTKMHGIGNDYVYVDGFEETIPAPEKLAVQIADRHFGVGGDGLILILPPEGGGHARMRMFNADGSEAQMCGNGVRCLAKYVHDHGLSKKNPLQIETAAGVKTIELTIDRRTKAATSATVDMGEPILTAAEIPVNIPRERVVDTPMPVKGQNFQMTCVSMGNPHAVMFTNDVSIIPLEEVGPIIERHPLFPERVNAHFVQVHSTEEVTMRTWERGSGATLACGTGASAVCVAGFLTRRTGRKILAHLPGGDLNLEWREDGGRVYMTGPAREVFTGEWPD